jgi:hypothetical protein
MFYTAINARRVELNQLLKVQLGLKKIKDAKSPVDTALPDMQDLMAKGILVKEDAGGRSTNYEMKKIL